MIATQFTIKII